MTERYVENLRAGLLRSMEMSPDVVVLGEDILDPYGGAFKVTKGVSTAYPDRVFTTPISEAAITGTATGLAIRGFLPVAEIMFGDFVALCADQIVNSACKFPLMYGDKVQVPWVIRVPMGGGRGYGPTHSQSLEKMFFGVPGLKIVAPSLIDRPGDLLQAAILGDSTPVLFIEEKQDYARALLDRDGAGLTVEDIGDDALYPLHRVRNFEAAAQRADVAIIAYGGAATIALDVARKLVDEEICVELFLPTEINSTAALQTIARACPAETPVVIVENGTSGFNWASEVSDTLHRHATGSGPAQVERVACAPGIIPSAKRLERETIVTEDKVIHAIQQVLL